MSRVGTAIAGTIVCIALVGGAWGLLSVATRPNLNDFSPNSLKSTRFVNRGTHVQQLTDAANSLKLQTFEGLPKSVPPKTKIAIISYPRLAANDSISSISPPNGDLLASRNQLAGNPPTAIASYRFDIVPPSDSLFLPVAKQAIVSSAAKDEALNLWLTNWLGDTQPQPLSTSNGDQLKQLLHQTSLRSSDLLAIAEDIKIYLPHQNAVIGSFAAETGLRLHFELLKYAIGSTEYYKDLYRLITVKKLLWHAIDGGESAFACAQLAVCDDLMTSSPGDEPALKNAKIHGFIGGAECLNLLGRNQEALNRLDDAKLKNSMNEEQTIATAWAKGEVLFSLKQYAGAILEFSTVANHKDCEHAEAASGSVVQIYALLHNKTQAVEQFKHHISEYKLTDAQAMRMAFHMQAELQSK